jgi:Zn-dependent protease
MRATWRLGKWRGIPVSLHWTVFIGLPWFYYQTRSVSATALCFAAFFFLLVAHEIGHAAVALWRNVGVDEIKLFFIHGLCMHDEPYYGDDDVLIAWGGVAAQVVVLVIAFGCNTLLGILSPYMDQVASPVFRVLIETNFVIMILNLMPVPPLDGVKAWRILPLLRARAQRTSGWLSLRKLLVAHRRSGDRRLEVDSERMAADVIDRLRKGKPNF